MATKESLEDGSSSTEADKHCGAIIVANVGGGVITKSVV